MSQFTYKNAFALLNDHYIKKKCFFDATIGFSKPQAVEDDRDYLVHVELLSCAAVLTIQVISENLFLSASC